MSDIGAIVFGMVLMLAAIFIVAVSSSLTEDSIRQDCQNHKVVKLGMHMYTCIEVPEK